MKKYIKREIENKIWEALEAGFIVAVLGARQTGKTTLLNHLSFNLQNKGVPQKNIFFFNLDDVILRGEIISNFYFIRNFIEERLGKNLKDLSSPIYLFIDEVQKAPSVFDLLKILYDNFSEKIKIIISGSSSLTIQKKSAESLAGRMVNVYLYPLSIREILIDYFNLSLNHGLFEALIEGKRFDLDFLLFCQTQVLKQDYDQKRQLDLVLKQALLDGTLPAVFTRVKEKEYLFKSLLETYLEKDIRRLEEVGSLDDFSRLISLLSFEIGSTFNIASLSRDLGIAINTVKKYLSVLQATFILKKLSPFFTKMRKRLVKSPKIYFFDVGLANFLAKRYYWENIIEKKGVLFENILLNSFEVFNNNFLKPGSCFFWRDYQGHEIDLVIENSKVIVPIEFTLERDLSFRKKKNFIYFLKEFKNVSFGIVIYTGQLEKISLLGKEIFFIPWWLWW